MRKYKYNVVWVAWTTWDHKTSPAAFLTTRLNELTTNGSRVVAVNPAHHITYDGALKLDGWDVTLETEVPVERGHFGPG